MPTGIRSKNFLKNTLKSFFTKKSTVYCTKEERSQIIKKYEEKGYSFIKQGKGEHGSVVLFFEKAL